MCAFNNHVLKARLQIDTVYDTDSFIFQQALMILAAQLVVSVLVAEAVCASNNDVFKARLLSSTLFMTGITTIAMSLIGIR